ncbi:hypothetical protein Tcan_09346 [Toxocara canis]|uniref:Uncharacterized protein n=1 Tax=Toxocara canis TaxID=6265 RepID=A0A0B2V2A7_TOXCA|nr:hypothetical protein Tcan_09346 [Toxocara canis]
MARTIKAASEMTSAVEEMMVPIAEGMQETMEQMMATMAGEMRKLLVATIRDVVGSLVPKLVITLTHSLDSILKSNSQRLQTVETNTSTDAEEQQRRPSAVFIGVPESRNLPHLRHEPDAESVAEILDELNVDGVPVDVYRMGVFNPTKQLVASADVPERCSYFSEATLLESDLVRFIHIVHARKPLK